MLRTPSLHDIGHSRRPTGDGSVLDDHTAAFLEGDCSLILGITLDDGSPCSSQAWGAQVTSRDPAVIRLVVAGRDAERLPDAVGRPLALTGADVPTLSSLQVKGRIIDSAAPTDGDFALAQVHTADFFDAVYRSDGEPVSLLRRMVPPTYWVWTVEVSSVFDQTPGPGAGSPLPDSGQR
jgi:hypothetical protein